MAPTNANSAGGDGGARQAFWGSKSATNSQPYSPTQQAKQRDSAALAVLDLLCESFPKCFVHYEARRRPLKIGIHLDLLAALDGAVTAAELGRALRIYPSNAGYLDACRLAAARIDLDGNECGEVSPEHAGQSAKLWAQQKARLAARRAQAKERAAAAKATTETLPGDEITLRVDVSRASPIAGEAANEHAAQP